MAVTDKQERPRVVVDDRFHQIKIYPGTDRRGKLDNVWIEGWPGNHPPLRVRPQEWDMLFEEIWGMTYDGYWIYVHPRFTLRGAWEYHPRFGDFSRAAFEVATGRHSRRFGPYAHNELAADKVREFLIAEGALEILDQLPGAELVADA